MLALHPTRVLTPAGFAAGHCVLIADGRICAVTTAASCPSDVERLPLEGDLVPGFIDLQVNGGGGVLLNDEPTVDGIAAIAAAHRRFGTTALLPTLISDDLDVVARAIAAVDAAIEAGVPGVVGIHIEGPFLNTQKKGIHDASKFRPLDAEAVALLSSLRRGRTLVTLAPELAPPGSIRALVSAGVVVAAGHTNATFEEATAAIDEGLTGVTHLFNAMTQLQSRAPGMVGAALRSPNTWCGLIVDGHHVHPAALQIAFAVKGAEALVLVTDAMPTVGSATKSFELGGQTIVADDGRCVAPDGTLAGSDLDMAMAVRNAVRLMALEPEAALRMASASPARAIRLETVTGSIESGKRADLVLLDSAGQARETWIAGERRRAAA